jgi:predicted nucleic acid-binding protein
MIVLDTNVISALMRSELNPLVTEWANRQPQSLLWTTSVTLMEIRSGLLFMPEGRRRNLLSQGFDNLLSSIFAGRILAFDVRAAEQAAMIDLAQHRKGRNIGVADLQIAGIAIAQGATLATRNTKDFAGLGIPLVDPWEG